MHSSIVLGTNSTYPSKHNREKEICAAILSKFEFLQYCWNICIVLRVTSLCPCRSRRGEGGGGTWHKLVKNLVKCRLRNRLRGETCRFALSFYSFKDIKGEGFKIDFDQSVNLEILFKILIFTGFNISRIYHQSGYTIVIQNTLTRVWNISYQLMMTFNLNTFLLNDVLNIVRRIFTLVAVQN